MTEIADSSAPLKNPRHENFALAIGKGESARDAYKNAGFAPKNDATADACASRLLSEAKVSARVSWLKSQVAAAVVSERVMDLNEVLEELSKLGRSSIQDVIVAGDDTGEVVQSLRDMKPEHAATIQELTVETYIEGAGDDAREVKRVKVRLHNKLGALTELRKHLEPQKHADPDGRALGTGAAEAAAEAMAEQLTDLDIARRIAFALEKTARAKPSEVPKNPKPNKGKQHVEEKSAARG